MKVRIAIITGLCAALFCTPVSAQDEQCVDASAVSTQNVVSDASATCCAKKTDGKKRRCLNAANRSIKKTRRTLGKSAIKDIVAGINGLKNPLCEGTGTQTACTNASATTVAEAVASINGSCCGKKFQNSRKACLKRQRRFVRGAKKFLGGSFYQAVRSETRALNKAASCGAGGKKSACDVTLPNSDGGGNWLHKPHSDSTGSIVNLLPSSNSASSCRYETSTGRLVRDAYMSGRTNGFRETWRPQGGGSCGGFPSNLVFSCQIGGKRVCRKMQDPCNRYD